MESSASFHDSQSKDVMQNYTKYKGNVILVDKKSLYIMGVGDVVLNTTFAMEWTFKNVKFLLDLKMMLISVWNINYEGHHVTFSAHQWKVTNGNLNGC